MEIARDLLQAINVLVDKGKRRIGRPFCKNVWLRDSVFRRQIQKKRRILRIGGPRRRRGKLRSCKKGQFGRVFRASSLPQEFSQDPPAPGDRAERQHGLIMYKLPNTSECFMPIRVAP